jgi:hypothetical protein
MKIPRVVRNRTPDYNVPNHPHARNTDAGALPSKSTTHVWRQTNDILTMPEFQIKHLTRNLIGC